jgi:CYTH domain-containing protein
MTSQRIGKYACLEIERRYLLKDVPADLALTGDGWRITDRYIPDTRLRLRCMESMAGEGSIFKLTQKYRASHQAVTEATITNMYLSEEEHNRLKALDARILQKVRRSYRVQSRDFSVDVFEGRHRGLILAELELEVTMPSNDVDLPSFILKEITNDPFFSGGNLAMMTDEEFRQGLRERI